jgi:hypothetical protein
VGKKIGYSLVSNGRLEGGVVDGVEIEAEELAGLVFGLLREVGEVDVESGWGVRGRGEQVMGGEFVADVGGAGGGGIDETDFVTNKFFQNGHEQWVVGAAEEEGVDVALEHRREVLLEHKFQGWMVEPALLDERNEEWGGPGVDLQVWTAQGQVVLVGVAFDGALGANDADALAMRCGESGSDAGLQDAKDGNAERGSQGVERVGGGGVAGDDNSFDSLIDEELGVFERETADGLGRFGAVGDAGGVAQVNDRLVREQFTQSTDNGQTADAGVEDAKGGVGGGGVRPGGERLFVHAVACQG